MHVRVATLKLNGGSHEYNIFQAVCMYGLQLIYYINRQNNYSFKLRACTGCNVKADSSIANTHNLSSCVHVRVATCIRRGICRRLQPFKLCACTGCNFDWKVNRIDYCVTFKLCACTGCNHRKDGANNGSRFFQAVCMYGLQR